MNIILSGLGGQGILFMTKIISLTAIKKGYKVLASETHGMAQRGGSVISHLKIGNVFCSQINSGFADYIISLDESEAYRNLHYLKNHGEIFTNISETFNPNSKILNLIAKKKILCNKINAIKIIQKLLAPISLNLAILGYFCSFQNNILTKKETRETIREVSPKKFIDLNLKVFDFCSNSQKLKK